MNDILRDLLLNGFMIYPNKGKFIVKKESVPTNTTVLKETEYDNYDLAVEAASKMLNTVQPAEWACIVRYNRGLGIEYKNLPDVTASSIEEAKRIADELVQRIFGESATISEVRVRLKK